MRHSDLPSAGWCQKRLSAELRLSSLTKGNNYSYAICWSGDRETAWRSVPTQHCQGYLTGVVLEKVQRSQGFQHYSVTESTSSPAVLVGAPGGEQYWDILLLPARYQLKFTYPHPVVIKSPSSFQMWNEAKWRTCTSNSSDGNKKIPTHTSSTAVVVRGGLINTRFK